MTYKHIKKIQLTILISIAIFIFTKNFQLLLTTRKIAERSIETAYLSNFPLHLVKNEAKPNESKSKHAFSSSYGPKTVIFDQYIKEKQSQSTSSLSSPSDRAILWLKRTTYQAFIFIKNCLISVKYRLKAWQKSLKRHRQYFLERLERLVGTRGRPLAEGMLFGELSGVSQDLYHSFKVIGILHLLSASSANFTLFLHFILFFFRPFNAYLSQKWRFILHWLIIFVYFSLVGVAASTLRAFVSLTLSFLASFIFHRPPFSLFNLGVAAGFILLINPFYLMTLGFQFSFLASFGIIFFNEFIEKDLHIKTNMLSKNIFLTLSAQFFLLPIMVANFAEINYLAIPANLCVLPLVEILTLLFLAAVVFIFGSLFFDLSILEWFLSYSITNAIDIFYKIINFFDLIPWKSIDFEKNQDLCTAIFVLFELLVIIAIFLFKKKRSSIEKYRTIC